MIALFRKVAAAATIAFAAWTAEAAATEVFIQSNVTHGFARVQAGVLHANGHADNAIRLTMVRLEGDKVAFRAPDGTYLRAGVSQKTLLATGSPHIRGWETFELLRIGSAHGLRSVQNGKFVVVDRRTGLMSATANVGGEMSMVRIINAPARAPVQAQPQRPRVDWTGRWTRIWVASPNGSLHRPPAGSSTDFTINTSREIEMTAGCNTKYANLSLDGVDGARFRNPMTTRRNCADAQQAYENAFAQAMAEVRRYEVREGQVAFLDNRGRVKIQIGR